MVSDVTTERSNRTVRVDQDQLETNARAAAFMIVNSLVIQLRTLELGLGISSKTLTVYLTIALATVQKLARQYPIPVSLRSPDPVPPQLSGAISRRAIAATSGLPRETVRRIVDELIADGRIMRVGRSAVASVPGTLRRDGYLLGRVAAEVARNATLLLHLGVLTLNSPGHFKGEHDRSPIDPNSVADAAEFETIF